MNATAAAPHLYTLTGNLLAERTLTFATWMPGKTQRATAESFQVGGKGINVSKMLNRLGVPNTALCFAGGPPGLECVAWLRRLNFSFAAFPAQTPTRTGFVVHGGAQDETTFLGPDALPEVSAVQACADYLDAQPAGHVLALCGSFPNWTAAAWDPLRPAFERWQRRGMLVADTYGPLLTWIVHESTALIKINRAEFDGLFDESDRSPTVPARLRLALEHWPVRAWIITDGPNEVWFCQQGGEPDRLRPPSVQERSATGSGDVLFAGVLQALYHRQLDLRNAVASALPLAAANAAHPGVAEFPLLNEIRLGQ